MIANVISPYMSLPRHRKFFQYNIPFFLMANTIFRAIGQTKRIASLCPLTSSSQLNALHLDAPSLFSLFCGTNAKTKPLNVHDFDGNVITTRQLATVSASVPASPQTSTKMITSEEYKCFENVDNVAIDGSILEKQDEVRFSGTDNGIVSISETAPFSLRKLRYHLQLYDTYKTPTSTYRKLLSLLLLLKYAY